MPQGAPSREPEHGTADADDAADPNQHPRTAPSQQENSYRDSERRRQNGPDSEPRQSERDHADEAASTGNANDGESPEIEHGRPAATAGPSVADPASVVSHRHEYATLSRPVQTSATMPAGAMHQHHAQPPHPMHIPHAAVTMHTGPHAIPTAYAIPGQPPQPPPQPTAHVAIPPHPSHPSHGHPTHPSQIPHISHPSHGIHASHHIHHAPRHAHASHHAPPPQPATHHGHYAYTTYAPHHPIPPSTIHHQSHHADLSHAHPHPHLTHPSDPTVASYTTPVPHPYTYGHPIHAPLPHHYAPARQASQEVPISDEKPRKDERTREESRPDASPSANADRRWSDLRGPPNKQRENAVDRTDDSKKRAVSPKRARTEYIATASMPPMPQFRITYINGAFIPAEGASISVNDFGFSYGCSIVEEILVLRGIALRLDEHVSLFMSAAARLEIPLRLAATDLIAICRHLVDANRDGPRSTLCIQLSFGTYGTRLRRFPPTAHLIPTLVVQTQPLPAIPPAHFEAGIAVYPAPDRRPELTDKDNTSAPCVSTSQLAEVLAFNDAVAKGCEEAVLYEPTTNDVTGTTQGSIFCVKFGIIYTPPATGKVVDGVMRKCVLRACSKRGLEAREVNITLPFLRSATEMFCVSSLDLVVPVRAVGDRKIDGDVPGPVTRQVMDAIQQMNDDCANEARRVPANPSHAPHVSKPRPDASLGAGDQRNREVRDRTHRGDMES